ncbi:hypothetical protein [Oryzifoliimicrobium ureilyticus]|uniref:hypothetical protein n=1 Tax=Oryzifoliimicrobium ureilyticus TaxID=3113724 RepID=UPI0030764D0A
MKPANDNYLPAGLMPRGLNRTAAAAYVGIGATTFDMMVADGSMPAPKRARGRVLWDRYEIDTAFEALPSDAAAKEAGNNPWDQGVSA